jgi:hypothetical protein
LGRTLPGQTDSSTFPDESGTYVVLCLLDTDDPDSAASYLFCSVRLVTFGVAGR